MQDQQLQNYLGKVGKLPYEEQREILSLLEKLTGFKFETYAPLAGAEIRIREPKRRDNE